MANNSLFLNIATVLWAANISAQKDEGGNLILPNTLEAIPGLVMLVSSCPLLTGCDIFPFI